MSVALSIIFLSNSAYGATVFYANGAFTQNGIEWCEENKPLYDMLGEKFFEHHNHSIESRVCANLIEDKLWSYTGPDRVQKLIEKSSYFSELEISESQEEAKAGVLDTNPADVPEREIEVLPENIVEEKEEVEQIQEISEEGGGCLIATATFDSEMSLQVQMLRELRDNQILKTNSGNFFMSGFNQFYYTFSPTIADWERQSPVFKEGIKITLVPLLSTLSLMNYLELDSEEKIIGYGIGLIILNIGIYFGIPIFTILAIRNYERSFLSWKRSEPNQTYLK